MINWRWGQASCLSSSGLRFKDRLEACRHVFVDRVGLPIRMADERQVPTVRGPGRHVDGSLSAIDVGDHLRFATVDRHHAQVDVLVERMLVRRDVLGEGEKHDALAVGRDMGKPVVQLVVSQLLSARFRRASSATAASFRFERN